MWIPPSKKKRRDEIKPKRKKKAQLRTVSNSPRISEISAKHLARGRPVPQSTVVQGSTDTGQRRRLRLSDLIGLLPLHPTEANVHFHYKSSQMSLQTCKLLSVAAGELYPVSHPQPLGSQITCPFTSTLLGLPCSCPRPRLLPWCLFQHNPSWNPPCASLPWKPDTASPGVTVAYFCYCWWVPPPGKGSLSGRRNTRLEEIVCGYFHLISARQI